MTDNNYRKTVLENGIRIVTETLPVRTVSVGILVDTGSRDENTLNSGSAHFVEHMFFKGTPKRNAIQIAKELDELGGASNAFTTKETTCLYATVLDSQLSKLMAIFSDLFLNSEFSPTEVERERSVILQEIDMVEDSPEDLIHDYYSNCIWAGHPLSNTILGSKDVVASITSEQLKEYILQNYSPYKIIISAAGNVDHDQFVDLLKEKFSRLKKEKSGDTHLPRTPPLDLSVSRKIYSRPLEQAHLVLGTYGFPANSPNRYALMLLNVLLGGNMSSKLFQEVREKRGLAYSIYSFLESNCDAGQIGIYTGINPKNVNSTIKLIESIVSDFGRGSINQEELESAKGYAKASLYLSAENMDSRMLRLAKNELIFNRHIQYLEVDSALSKVTCDEVNELAAKIFSTSLSGVVLGPLGEKEIQFK